MPGWGSEDIAALVRATEPLRWQRSLRWQKPARDWRRLLPAFVAGILCTALPIVLFDAAMRTELRRLHAVATDMPITVELLTEPETPAPRIERPLAEPAATRTESRDRRRPPVDAGSAPSITRTQEPPPAPAASLRLFGLDGAIELPAPATPTPETFAAPARKPLAHESPLPYEETRFDRMMPSVRESLGAELVRKTTWTRTWHTRSGTRIQCVTSLVMAGLGICGWGIEPRATAEELRAMRADPPMRKPSNPDEAQ
ncbi:MAG: hypothetical protein ABW186_08880 [Rhodanobacteraceae bacterium]